MRIFEIETEEIYSSDYSGCFPVSDPVDLSDDNTFYDGAIYGSGILILCMNEREATQTKKKTKKAAPKKGW